MIVMALDTAGTDCAAAIYDSGSDTVLAEVTDPIGRGHAEHLMGIIDKALAQAGITLKAVERVVVTVGPGSFTGIRVGVAAARGFALSLAVPAVGVSTLEVLAAAERERTPDRPVLAGMDAKRGEVYLQPFDATGAALAEPQAVTIEDARAAAAAFDGELAGSAVPLMRGNAAGSGEPDHFPISIVAKLGAMAPADQGRPKPIYLRGPDAKPQSGFAVARV